MKRTHSYALPGFIATLLLAIGAPAFAADDEIAAQIQELKKGQEDIKRELEEIKKLLTPKPPPPQVDKLEATVAIGDIETRGRPDAPVTMIEFSDYQCPFCKRHIEQTVPELVRGYVETGKVRYAFRDFPLSTIHPLAAKAAEAARCAGDQGKYWEMHDRLFANQQALQPDKLPEHAKAVGLDEGKFKECLDSGRFVDEVKRDVDDGTKLGIRGTPTVVVGISDGNQVTNATIIRGAQPLATFKTELDKLLAPAAAAK